MIQFDFNALLKTMDKAGIMAMVEKEVDKVIAANQAAKEVEQERYKIAKANVDCDNYSLDDLIILGDRLNRMADTKVEEAKSIRADFIKPGKKPKHLIETKPLIMTPEEFAKFLDASLGDIKKRKKSSEKTTYDGYFKDSFF